MNYDNNSNNNDNDNNTTKGFRHGFPKGTPAISASEEKCKQHMTGLPICTLHSVGLPQLCSRYVACAVAVNPNGAIPVQNSGFAI